MVTFYTLRDYSKDLSDLLRFFNDSTFIQVVVEYCLFCKHISIKIINDELLNCFLNFVCYDLLNLGKPSLRKKQNLYIKN